jgi:hypothetical protein
VYLKLETERVKSNSERQIKTQNSAIIKTDLTAIIQIIFKKIFQFLPPQLEIMTYILQHMDGDLVYEVQNMSHMVL